MKRSLLALAVLSLPLAAGAADLNYNYIEGGYNQLDPDGGGSEADGFGLNGSVSLGQSLFLYGGWSSNEIDGTSADIDVQRIGLGWRNGIGDRTDLVVNANYLKFDVDAGGGVDFDADGYEAEVGVRHAFGDRFEGQASLGYVDGGDFSGTFYGKLTGQFRFNQNWGLVGSTVIRDDVKEYFIGPRLSF
ncbi:outer membrane beta-barrel protein [Pseudomarimonas salicorniae]|uniref:Porin family protein n=1 Tax=Pseudomarimonas salicorniae TaxID=2933270 RepID=A0ABT0GE54_9GAMM|nr:outer membrane beta-barrel protein [Lysobacter sp. CAU 1642]MCK7592439.1 porin family protein [Lysobacter sp. CAU 1642]